MEQPDPQSPTDRPIPAPLPAALPLMVRIFMGPAGLRAGWRFLLYLSMFAVFSLLSAIVLRSFNVGNLTRIWGIFVSECVSLAGVIIPALVMAKIENRSFGDYGLPRQGAFGRPFWIGAIWGFLGLTLLMVMMRLSGAFYFGTRVLHGQRILKFALFYAVLFLIVGLFEEFWFRGYTLFTLSLGIGFWPAAIVLSFTFGAIHLGNQGEALIGGAAAALIGLFFSLTLRRTGSLWFAVGFQAAWDWGETFFYSVPDSGMRAPGHLMRPSFQGSHWLTGGSVGPEGSVFVFVTLAILWLVFHRTYREAKFCPESLRGEQRNQILPAPF